jgi:hypothetical protein
MGLVTLCLVVPRPLLNAQNAAAPEPAVSTNKSIKVPDIIYKPTPQDRVEMMLILANLRTNGVVYDLGNGDGRIVIAGVSPRSAGPSGSGWSPGRKTSSCREIVLLDPLEIGLARG